MNNLYRIFLAIIFTTIFSSVWFSAFAQPGAPTGIAIVSAASYEPQGSLSPESIAAAFGSNLASATAYATDTNPQTPEIELPTTLAGTTVQVNGINAGILFVSPGQVNFVIPMNISTGSNIVKITSGSNEYTGMINIESVHPAIITFNGDGAGVIAANVVRVKANGTQIYEALYSLDPQTNRYVTKPIDMGPADEHVFLEIYLTGIRRAPDENQDGNLNENVWVILGGQMLVPSYANKHGFFAGIDQVNVEIPRNLIGKGILDLAITARNRSCIGCQTSGGFTSNSAKVEIAMPTVPNNISIDSINPNTASVGQAIAINGQGFSTTPSENIVTIGGVRAVVTASNATQLNVNIPAGAKTGVVGVRTTQGQGRSLVNFNVATSLTGVVETLNPAVANEHSPIQNIIVRVVGTNISAVTNAQGLFTLPAPPTGNITLEIDPSSLPVSTQFTKFTSSVTIQSGQDNLMSSPIWLTQNGMKNVTTGAGTNAIVGTVTEKDGLTPASQAWVRLTDGSAANLVTMTDGNGGYVIRNVTPGSYSLIIDYIQPYGNHFQMSGSVTILDGVATPIITNKNLSLKEAGNHPPLLLVPANVSMNLGNAVDIKFYATDPDLSDALSISASGPPTLGLIAGTNGIHVLRFNPGGTGLATINLTARDGFGNQVTQIITVNVNGMNTPPTLTVPGQQTGKVGQTLTFNVSATDPDNGQTLTLAVANMPQGATFTPVQLSSPLTGAFTWTPAADQTGTFVVTFTATDNANPAGSDSKSVSIKINP